MKTSEEILEEFASERQRVELYSRVMGYIRPVDQWNAGKQAEHHERLFFKEKYLDKFEKQE